MWRGNRLIYIPTDRPCVEAIKAAVLETAEIAERDGRQGLFVLVEQPSSPAYTGLHAATIFSAARDAGVAALHLTTDAWKTFVDQLLGQQASPPEWYNAISQLNTTDRAYGVAPNKLYLVAAALGATIVHRRDSDHIPDVCPNGSLRFPGVLESAAIGRTPEELGLDPLLVKPGRSKDSHIYFAGSSMFGEPPVDRRSLIACGVTHLYRLEQLAHPERAPDQVRQRVQSYYFEDPRQRFANDFFAVDTTGSTEIGVSCIKDSFLYLPEAPLRRTLGTDYMVKNLMYQLGRPVIFHSRKMVHRYSTDRAHYSDEDAIEYAISDLKFLVLRRLLAEHNQDVRDHPALFEMPAGGVNAALYADNLQRVVQQADGYVNELPAQFASVYRDASEGPTDSARVNRAIAARAVREGMQLVDDVRAGLGNYCRLVTVWPGLVERARAVGSRAIDELITARSGS